MTHVQFADPQDVPRFGALHVIAALQLLWAVADPSTNEVVKPYIDPAHLSLDVSRALHPGYAAGRLPGPATGR